MRLLDLFCGAGGCSVGYSRAGFTEIVGVDNRPMPRYPFTFVQADALEYVAAHGRAFDAIHASPPCQKYCTLAALSPHKEYPDLLDPTRQALRRVGRPHVIENVPGAPVESGVLLCGTMFGLRVYRHRYFECSFFPWAPQHNRHRVLAGVKGTKGGRQRKAHYASGGFVTIAGDVGSWAGVAVGIDWMIGDELSQAIPPAYTEFIGRQLLAAIEHKSSEHRHS